MVWEQHWYLGDLFLLHQLKKDQTQAWQGRLAKKELQGRRPFFAYVLFGPRRILPHWQSQGTTAQGTAMSRSLLENSRMFWVPRLRRPYNTRGQTLPSYLKCGAGCWTGQGLNQASQLHERQKRHGQAGRLWHGSCWSLSTANLSNRGNTIYSITVTVCTTAASV